MPDHSGFETSEKAKNIELSLLSKNEQKKNAMLVVSKLRNSNKSIENQILYNQLNERDINMYWIEFHRKFALTYAIIVLFFLHLCINYYIRIFQKKIKFVQMCY